MMKIPKFENVAVTAIVTVVVTIIFLSIFFSTVGPNKGVPSQDLLNLSTLDRHNKMGKPPAENDNEVFKLMWAKDYEQVKKLVDEKSELLLLHDSNGEPLLHKAIRDGNRDLISFFLKREGSHRIYSAGSISPIYFALEQEDRIDILKTFLENGVDINNCYEIGDTILQNIAYRKNGREFIEFLLNHGANVNSRNEYGLTPIFIAALEAKPEIVSLLIDRGADVNAKSKYGFAPLHMVLDTESEKILIDSGADVNARGLSGETPLHYFMSGKSPGDYHDSIGDWDNWIIGRVKVLLDNGADINALDSCGRTPVFHAAMYGRTKVVKFLVSRGADASIKDRYGDSPLSYAVGRREIPTASFLAFTELKQNKALSIILLLSVMGILCLAFYRLFMKKKTETQDGSRIIPQ